MRRRACTGKIRFATLDLAIGLCHTRKLRGRFLTAYPCRWCGGFHMGHAPGFHARQKAGRRGLRA